MEKMSESSPGQLCKVVVCLDLKCTDRDSKRTKKMYARGKKKKNFVFKKDLNRTNEPLQALEVNSIFVIGEYLFVISHSILSGD